MSAEWDDALRDYANKNGLSVVTEDGIFYQFETKIKGRWIVHTKGGPNLKSFEICVIREDNAHGRLSYGWFGPSKLLISHNGGPCHWPVTSLVWDRLIRAANEVAGILNEEELP